MLLEIYIKNFVLIDELRVEFSPGLNVLTGETGAGKSIIIDALGLLMGERIKNDYLRDENTKAIVEAVFDVSNNEEAVNFLKEISFLEEDEDHHHIVISREISPNGKNLARVNGRIIMLNNLKNLTQYLLDMHIQHEHIHILNPLQYLFYLDSFASGIDVELQKLNEIYTILKKNKNELEDLQIKQENRKEEIDLSNYQIEELEKADIQVDEEDTLIKLRDRVKNSKNLLSNTSELIEILYSSSNQAAAYDLMARSINIVRENNDEEFFNSLQEPLENIYYSLEEIASTLANFKDSLDFEPALLEETEERLYEIRRLKKKYGVDLTQIPVLLSELKEKKARLENSEEFMENLKNEIDIFEDKYLAIAKSISAKRMIAAELLEKKVHEELISLNMPHLEFKIIFKQVEARSNGCDEVDFLFSPNPGEALKPLAKIASGGEISRFVLALKKVLANYYNIPTFIFDEIDVGVGGTALSTMSKKLFELALSHQIILVTHAPQIASYAETHYRIEKIVKNERTYSSVKKLAEKECIHELARMLDGEKYSKLSLEHAREMLEKSRY